MLCHKTALTGILPNAWESENFIHTSDLRYISWDYVQQNIKKLSQLENNFITTPGFEMFLTMNLMYTPTQNQILASLLQILVYLQLCQN